jgi:hypothetical protein
MASPLFDSKGAASFSMRPAKMFKLGCSITVGSLNFFKGSHTRAIAQGGAVHFIRVGPSAEKQPKTPQTAGRHLGATGHGDTADRP